MRGEEAAKANSKKLFLIENELHAFRVSQGLGTPILGEQTILTTILNTDLALDSDVDERVLFSEEKKWTCAELRYFCDYIRLARA